MKVSVKKNPIVFEKLKKIKDARVRVGWFEESKYDDNTPVANVAFWQEYGTKRGIPERPFMRPAAFHNEKKWIALAKQEVAKCVESGKSLTLAMDKLGFMVQGDIQFEISSVYEPELKESTIKARLRRKSVKKVTASLTKPLIDTGTMLASVQHKVEEC